MSLAPARPPSTVSAGLLSLALLACPDSSARAQSVDAVFPVEPSDGAVVGTRPKFNIGFKGTELPKVQFKIELSHDDFETIDQTFDWREERNGWAYNVWDGANGAIYMPRKPIPDGTYFWRVYAWNGLEWVRGKSVHKVIIDAVPPADVEGLKMRVDREKGIIVLDWNLVSVDREGRSERVALYHIYRYERLSFFFVMRPFEIGTSETTRFEDKDPRALQGRLLFYKVAAEDEAGNQAEHRY